MIDVEQKFFLAQHNLNRAKAAWEKKEKDDALMFIKELAQTAAALDTQIRGEGVE